MSLLHQRWRRRASLLASGALEGAEREATLAHLDACARCREEHAGAEALLRLLARDPARDAEPGIPVSALTTRVLARLDAGRERRLPAWRWAWAAGGFAAASALAIMVLPRAARTPAPAPTGAEEVYASEEALRRLERTLAREQAVRYLNQAQDVLVTMASAPPCEKNDRRLDVEEEARRSRELLERRALLVELSGDDVASARPVLEDVEQMLREVAALESCVRVGDVERVQREMERRRLLMKIRLMSRELQG